MACYVCGKDSQKRLHKLKIIKVRDHCHFTGKYRGVSSIISGYEPS